ncbi:hypothetical protein MJ563_06935 [Klebsiella pneumoniae]|nr:hypothetical protein MJ563_06935 [Klebsiella pneumoniae]
MNLARNKSDQISDSERSEQRSENTCVHAGDGPYQAPHSATAQFFINVVDNDFLNFSGESLQATASSRSG